MLGIGEFSGLTGLSVKALRHYDEKGILVPADVDDRSGYRRYGERQVRDGVVVQALRDAGVPLPAVAAALAADSAADALTAHRELVREQRAREDLAFANAHAVLRALTVPVTVIERDSGRQPFVGRVISGSPEDLEALDDEAAGTVFAELFEQLQDAGLGPSGTFWTTMRTAERGTVELVCCWPTADELDPAWGGAETLVGVLPPRTELVASWHPTAGDPLPEGSTHPAVVALFDAIADRDLDPRGLQVRQSVVAHSETDYTVEVAFIV